MDFIERLQTLAKKVEQFSETLATEEATKNALVMPFLHSVLGYDVFNPQEVIPEFTADTATKKGEKVDYALMKEGEVQILIECKKFGETLSTKHASQLFRYFSVTNARIAILTNGAKYQFFTDLDAPNKMDEKPFLTLDLENLDEHIVPEVKKLTKSSFDVDSVVDAAGELKYLSQIKKVLGEQFSLPEEDFVKFFTSKVYDGVQTSKVKAQFLELTQKALKQFLNDSINARLQSAIGSDSKVSQIEASSYDDQDEFESEGTPKIVTTDEEIEGFNVVKAILRQKLDVSRIHSRDTQSYFGVLLDDNNRKPLCRLHFNAKQKYLGVLDEDRKETRYPINRVDDIFNHTDVLLSVADRYVQIEPSAS
ncbi:type I restriction endonuclease [Photobacterium halotolerans]|uniref:Restriction endonuclease or methylase n=1 Tax=Photobacterium halotolerans TaxID=265726 RepID=A0A0F5VFM0_9GAMM|nr:type I restriction endonuclease [Photobacterium halotolerans]KKD00858.1 restriction endonuclease or methylase [Photobacterium halotolerans]